MRPTTTHKEEITTHETWEIALQWVSANQKIIRQIASPYLRFMVAEKNDLLQEAAIAAFNAANTARKKDKPEHFIKFFRVIFKTNCIKLASGIQTVHCLDDNFLIYADCREESKYSDETEGHKIEKALQKVSIRQRQICYWLLQQQIPVGTPDIARKFRVSRRHACRLVSSSIQRITETSH